MVKIYIISICLFVILSDVQVLSYRLSELLQTVQILLFPSMLYIFKRNSFVGKAAVVMVAFAFLLMNVFYNGYFYK